MTPTQEHLFFLAMAVVPALTGLVPAWHEDWVRRGGTYDVALRRPDGP